MYNSTPRKASQAKDTVTPNKKIPLKGLFDNGVWHCNCSPRLPASHFLVRKEGPNKGRWFYTCQEPKESGCGFFLWDDAAKPREISAVISNSRSEPAAMKTPADAQRDALLNRPSVEDHINASNKWMADLGKKDEEEFGDWPLSLEDEQDLARVETPMKPGLPGSYPPETPRKATKFDAMATPTSKRKREEEAWPTPQSLQNGPDTPTRLKGGMWDGNERHALMSPAATPTPLRSRDAEEGTSPGQDYEFTVEIMELLGCQNLEQDVTSKLRTLLNKHALRMSGIAKGRDITRLALRAKDAKITELQGRIAALETAREMDKNIIQHFKSDMAQSINIREGRRQQGHG